MSPDNKFHKDEISQLISKGRKQGYLLFEEIDKTFTEDLDSEEDFDDFLSSMGDYGIKILDSRQKEMIPQRRKSDLVSTHGLERTTDPVKLYLREMGNISLLTREGEIAIAREIERGEKSIIKALSRTRLVLNQVLALEDRIKENPFIIQEMFDVSEEDIAEGKLEEKKKQILAKIKKIRDLSRQARPHPGEEEDPDQPRPGHRQDQPDHPRPQPPLGPPREDHRRAADPAQGHQRPRRHPRRLVRRPGQEEEGRSRPQAEAPRRQQGAPQADDRDRARLRNRCGGPSGPSRPARRSATRPRRSWSRPTCAWSSRSPRSTATAASSSSTSSRKATWA